MRKGLRPSGLPNGRCSEQAAAMSEYMFEEAAPRDWWHRFKALGGSDHASSGWRCDHSVRSGGLKSLLRRAGLPYIRISRYGRPRGPAFQGMYGFSIIEVTIFMASSCISWVMTPGSGLGSPHMMSTSKCSSLVFHRQSKSGVRSVGAVDSGIAGEGAAAGSRMIGSSTQ